MKNGRMLAIALDEEYDRLNAISEEVTEFLGQATSGTYDTSDNTYVLYFWGEWELSDQAYYELNSYLSTVRHSYVEYTEVDGAGKVIEEYKDEDEWGCDGEFSDMLHFNPKVSFFDYGYGFDET